MNLRDAMDYVDNDIPITREEWGGGKFLIGQWDDEGNRECTLFVRDTQDNSFEGIRYHPSMEDAIAEDWDMYRGYSDSYRKEREAREEEFRELIRENTVLREDLREQIEINQRLHDKLNTLEMNNNILRSRVEE